MTDLIIRRATPGDAGDISIMLAQLSAAGLRTRPDDAGFVLQNYIAHPDSNRCSVAELGGIVLGLQSLKLATAGNAYGVTPGWGMIGTHISPAAARQGIGRALFSVTLEAARDARLTRIDATIGTENAGGLAYYEAMGFRTYQTTETTICKCFQLPGSDRTT